MSRVTFKIPLNSESDIFHTCSAHLINFLQINANHVKAAECQTKIFRMHLEIVDLTLEEENAEKYNIEAYNTVKQSVQEVEAKIEMLQNSLKVKDDRKDDDLLNKLIKRIKKLENNKIFDKNADVSKHTIDERMNTLLGSSQNATKQIAQLEAKIKILENSLRVKNEGKNDIVNELIERISNHTIEINKINALLNSSNNATNSFKQIDEKLDIFLNSLRSRDDVVNKLIERLKNLENVIGNNKINDLKENKDLASTSKGHHMTPERQEGLKIIDCKENNFVYIMNIKCIDRSKNSAIVNVIELAKYMGLTLTRNEIKHIDVLAQHDDDFYYFVHFCNKSMKDSFLEKQNILKNTPHTRNVLIRDGAEYNFVLIKNFKSADLEHGIARTNVIQLAKEVGMILTLDDFPRVFVSRGKNKNLNYYVEFKHLNTKTSFITLNKIFQMIMPKRGSLKKND